MFEKRLNKTTKKFLVGFEGQGQEVLNTKGKKKTLFLHRLQGLFNRLGENVQPQEFG